ncbi:glutathione S-transferase N-terminal domain-containing protein [Kiloniella sp. b19]|uniref:glutathione S-transferase N-terminal domain-containing protein n=1 Tax=Kiloniella sp. GXU_MW_B19 TaxID=3141326 RepID=UPI0031D241C7
MKFYTSLASPYARKVMMVALEKGLSDELELVYHPTTQPDSPIWHANPMGKVPALETREGIMICDSLPICDYLNTIGEGPDLMPRENGADWAVHAMATLANGLCDAAVARMLNKKSHPPEMQWQGWQDMQLMKINRTLDMLEKSFDFPIFEGLNLASLTLAIALDYLDFRFPQEDWRLNRPNLSDWYEKAMQRDSFQKTRPQNPPA